MGNKVVFKHVPHAPQSLYICVRVTVILLLCIHVHTCLCGVGLMLCVYISTCCHGDFRLLSYMYMCLIVCSDV